MSKPAHARKRTLREKITAPFFTKGDLPIMVYLTVFGTMALLWYMRERYDGLPLDFMIELFGVAFTLFIIDIMLVRSKNKRWKVVRDDVNYLIARGVHRLRDGLATRFFGFNPETDGSVSLTDQRTAFFADLGNRNEEEIATLLREQEAFSNESYAYLNERAADIWSVLNMKYAEYFPPELVSQLISLHICLKDAGGHIRQYRKSERFVEKKEFYRTAAITGLCDTLGKAVRLLNALKDAGFSEPVRDYLSGSER